MVMWKIVYTRQALKDLKKIAQAGLKDKTEFLLEILRIDPFMDPPRYKKLEGNFKGCHSRRINLKHRLVYETFPENKTVKVLRAWSANHYRTQNQNIEILCV